MSPIYPACARRIEVQCLDDGKAAGLTHLRNKESELRPVYWISCPEYSYCELVEDIAI